MPGAGFYGRQDDLAGVFLNAQSSMATYSGQLKTSCDEEHAAPVSDQKLFCLNLCRRRACRNRLPTGLTRQ